MPLGRRALSGIVDIQIGRIRDRVEASYGTDVTLSPAAREALTSRAQSSEMGARAIESMIARDLLPVLSTFFLEAVAEGRKFARIQIDFCDHRFGIDAMPVVDEKEFAALEDQPADKAASNGAKAHSDAAPTRKAKSALT
jgi:type VI secretion system protein VasG